MAKRATEEDLETVHESVLVAPRPKDAVTRRRDQEEALGGIKNKLFNDSARVVEDFMRARDIDPMLNKEEDPAYYQMMSDLGDEQEVRKAYALARAGWLPGSETPAFVKVATQVLTGIMKANAAEKGGAKILNVERVILSESAIPSFPEREVE